MIKVRNEKKLSLNRAELKSLPHGSAGLLSSHLVEANSLI